MKQLSWLANDNLWCSVVLPAVVEMFTPELVNINGIWLIRLKKNTEARRTQIFLLGDFVL